MLLLHKPVADFTIGDFAWIFWDVSQITHLPTDQHSSLVSQFWFLQCLVLIILFSPVIWAGVKRFGLLIPLLFFVLDKTEVVPDWPGLVAYSWAYFTLGAFFAIRGISVSQLISRYQRPIGLAIAILLVLDVTLHQYGTQSFVVRHLLKSSLIALLFIVAQQMIARGCNMPSLLVGSTFFVFAVHRFFTAICTNVAGSVPLLTGNSLTALTTYVVSCALSTLLSVFFYWSCRHYFPKACNLLTGNRQ